MEEENDDYHEPEATSGGSSEEEDKEEESVGRRSEMDARRMYDSASVVVDEGRVCPLQGAVFLSILI